MFTEQKTTHKTRNTEVITMAMTNAQIVQIESFKLMEAGILKGSGVYGQTLDGKTVELPEEIHTYQSWKALGYQVQRGQKAIAQFPIWKYVRGKKNDEDVSEGYCRMVNASFFKKSQVQEVEK